MQRARFRQLLLWCLLFLNLSVIVFFWQDGSFQPVLSGELPLAVALGRLAGLLATFCALLQFILMSRAGWIEPVFGLDRLARFHRLNGYCAIIFMLIHPLLLSIGYGIFPNTIELLQVEYVPLAAIGLLLFLTSVTCSIYIARKHLRFETWYFIHLISYAAIALIPWHQLVNGGTLTAHPAFQAYWIGLYIFVGVSMLVWRFGMPIYKFSRHRFTVERTEATGPRATSVYISGRHMDAFKARGGQFVLLRFFQKGMWWQEHPFSLSALPNEQGIRSTIRQLGDFTNLVPGLKPGTKVLVSGPHGAFTLDSAEQAKLLFIAGGIGITPFRAMLEEEAQRAHPREAILLYANHDEKDIPLKTELEELASRMPLIIHHILSDDPQASEKGFIDAEKIARLAPDCTERAVFVCGPPPMMANIFKDLDSLGVPASQIHSERFSLHAR